MLTQLLPLILAAHFVSIEGRVRDAHSHNAISLVSVELWRAQTPVDRQYTDTEGRFRFADVAAGQYTVSVDIAGYEAAMVEIEVGMPSPDVSVAIDLVRKKTRSTSSSPVISLREYMVPPKAQKEFELARKEARQQGCSKAIAHFEKGLRIFDQDASAQNELGNCYRKLGQLDRAEDAFRRAQALSDSVYVALNLADVFAVQGRFNDAETVLLKVIQKQPEAGDAYYGLALIYFDQGRLADAQTAALQADGHRHKIADVHVLLAQIYARKQESSAAIEQLQLYLKEAPNGSQSELVRQILGSDQ